jgi:hypothetical protein
VAGYFLIPKYFPDSLLTLKIDSFKLKYFSPATKKRNNAPPLSLLDSRRSQNLTNVNNTSKNIPTESVNEGYLHSFFGGIGLKKTNS